MGTTKKVKSTVTTANIAYAPVPLWFFLLNFEIILLNISSWTICIYCLSAGVSSLHI